MKKDMLICAPVTSRSGYGEHARDLVRSFIEHNKYEIKILDVRWGDCPRNALDKNNTNDTKILNLIMTNNKIDKKPDIYVDIRIPNEFQQVGHFNIGITAGVETTAVSQAFLEGCNKMDLTIVPSNHSKEGFLNTVYDKVQNTPDGKQKKVGELKLEKPMEVLFEGADEDVYKPLDKDEIPTEFLDWLNNKVPEKFAFLFVGQWCKGNFGEDRKDIFNTIKVFYESFANKKKQPALILKTNGATYSIMDKEDCLTKINSIKSAFPKDWKLPNVYLLHGDLDKEEMNYLYNHPKVKAMVSFTHGEGFGRPLLEATMTGLPVMTSGWSGQLDFLDGERAVLVRGEMKEVPASQHWENIVIPESKWFNIDENSAYKFLNDMYMHNDVYKRRAGDLMEENRKKFTLSNMAKELDKIVEKNTKDLPSQVSIKLPKLKKTKEKI